MVILEFKNRNMSDSLALKKPLINVQILWKMVRATENQLCWLRTESSSSLDPAEKEKLLKLQYHQRFFYNFFLQIHTCTVLGKTFMEVLKKMSKECFQNWSVNLF